MKRMIDPEELRRRRLKLQEQFEAGELDLASGVRAIRKLLGLTQAEYAKRIGVAARAVIDLERGVGNPTLQTLLKLGKPFNLTVVYRSKRALTGGSSDQVRDERSETT